MASGFSLRVFLAAALLVTTIYSKQEGKGQFQYSYCNNAEDCSFLAEYYEDSDTTYTFATCEDVELHGDAFASRVCVLAFARHKGKGPTAKDPIGCTCKPLDSVLPKAQKICSRVLTRNNGILTYYLLHLNDEGVKYKVSSPKPGTTDVSYTCTNPLDTSKSYIVCPVNAEEEAKSQK